MAAPIRVGDLVLVGPAYTMGGYTSDEYAGATYRVVALRPAGLGPASAALAPPTLLEPTEDDEVVDIALSRLTLRTPATGG